MSFWACVWINPFTPTQSPQPGEVDDLADDLIPLLPGLDLNEGRVDLKVELVGRFPAGHQDQGP